MPEPIKMEGIASIQIEAMSALAKSFDKRDYTNGLEYRTTLGALTKSIATASNSDVKVEGLKKLGDYASRTESQSGSQFLQIESVQNEAVAAIGTISSEDPDTKVKEVGLDQVTRMLNIKDYRNGEVHSGAIDAIRKIGTSVTLKEGDEAGAPVIKKTIDILSDYASRTESQSGSQFLQIESVQGQAKKIVQLISSTAGVEKFTNIKP